jgi:hypothetical protein
MNIPNRASRHQARRASRSWDVSAIPAPELVLKPDPEGEGRGAVDERLMKIPAKINRAETPRPAVLL